MLSTKQIFEISDLNKSRLGVAGKAALVGGAGFAAYHALKGNDVEKPESADPSTTSKVFSGDKTSAKRNVHNSGGYTGPSLKPKDDSGYKG